MTTHLTNFEEHIDSLTRFIDHNQSIDNSLHELALLVASTLHVSNCSLMFLKDNADPSTGKLPLRLHAHSGDIPESAFTSPKSATGIAEHVIRTGKALLVADILKSSFAEGATHKGGFITLPIRFDGKVMGVINISKPIDHRTFSDNDLQTATILSLYLAKSIQLLHLEAIFHSRFAMAALEREQANSTSPVKDFTGNPEKVVKILAKGFYHELKQMGIGSDHIITAATEMIGLLNGEIGNDPSEHKSA